VRSESRIESLLSRMTLDEKVGQLVQVGLGPPQNGGGNAGTNYVDMIKEGRIGAILGPDNAKDINTYQRMAVENSRRTPDNILYVTYPRASLDRVRAEIRSAVRARGR
jgi:hypothetical protein